MKAARLVLSLGVLILAANAQTDSWIKENGLKFYDSTDNYLSKF